MPIKPKPTVFCCTRCGWKGVFVAQSDCLIVRPWSECPKCGNSNFERKAGGLLTECLAKLGVFDHC